jgi:DNA repair ATPase RecN
MKCPKCASDKVREQYHLSAQMQTGYFICDSCTQVWTEWQQSLIDSQKAELERLKQEIKQANDRCRFDKQQIEALELQISCANTPLMADVLAERDKLKELLRSALVGLNKARITWSLEHHIMKCNGCDAFTPCKVNEYNLPTCKPDCWLSKLIEEIGDSIK